MTIRSLKNTSFDDLLTCFLLAFENYYVKMPTNPDYYAQRWKAAKVNYDLSYGMFDGDKLVGFIIHAVDQRFGLKTAYNTGTGVIPAYRQKRVVNSIYDFAIPELRKNGIRKCTLEVITKNSKAIRAYENVGFKICKNYKCYTGEIATDDSNDYSLSQKMLDELNWTLLPNQNYYSWDFQKETLAKGSYEYFEIIQKDVLESFFIVNRASHLLAQFDLLKESENGWNRLFSGINQISPKIKIINVDTRLKEKIEHLSQSGLTNNLDQFEMEFSL